MSANQTIPETGAYGTFFIAFEDDYHKERVQGFKDEYGGMSNEFQPVAWSLGRLGMTYILFAKRNDDELSVESKYFVYLEAPGSKSLQTYNLNDVQLFTLEQVRAGKWHCI